MPLINDFLTLFIGNLHTQYEDALKDLTEEQLYFRPSDKSNHIAFHAWHFLRTKDSVCNFILQDRKPPVWLRQNLHEAWGLPKVDQGTGMSPADANALRVPSAAALVKYGHDVHADILPYIQSVTQADLESIAKLNPFGERAKLLHIGQTIIAHGNGHLGQIYTLRAVQGLSGDSF